MESAVRASCRRRARARHVLDDVAVQGREPDAHRTPLQLGFPQPLEQLVEARLLPEEPVEAGGLEEEHLDVIGALPASDLRDGQLSVDERLLWVRFSAHDAGRNPTDRS